jgi:hypothetical protein
MLTIRLAMVTLFREWLAQILDAFFPTRQSLITEPQQERTADRLILRRSGGMAPLWTSKRCWTRWSSRVNEKRTQGSLWLSQTVAPCSPIQELWSKTKNAPKVSVLQLRRTTREVTPEAAQYHASKDMHRIFVSYPVVHGLNGRSRRYNSTSTEHVCQPVFFARSCPQTPATAPQNWSSTPPALALVVAGGAERSDSCEPREHALATSPAAATPVPAVASAPYAG